MHSIASIHIAQLICMALYNEQNIGQVLTPKNLQFKVQQWEQKWWGGEWRTGKSEKAEYAAKSGWHCKQARSTLSSASRC